MIRSLALCLALPTMAHAQAINFPSNASLQAETTSPADSYAMPIGPWINGTIPTQIGEGTLTQQSWRVEATGLTTLQILRPLREQLIQGGYEILFECQTDICGGFDFRFGTSVMRPPNMQINLGDFRFLAAQKPAADGPTLISLIVSETTQAGFIQITQVSPNATPAPRATAAAVRNTNPGDAGNDLPDALDTLGRVVLGDLTFETGAALLTDSPFTSLQALADYLAAHPDRTVALVGHTDSTGSLDGNIALSKRRARAVLERLVGGYNVPRRQLAAEGMGYLAPIATNLTAEGREANRRVEVIITSTSDQ